MCNVLINKNNFVNNEKKKERKTDIPIWYSLVLIKIWIILSWCAKLALSRIQLPQLLKSSLQNYIFSSLYFCQGVLHYMLIVLQKHYFIKWDQRKVPGFKESYCYSSVLAYFACGKTRLRCRKLALNNKYAKSIITLKCFQLLTYIYSCW